MKKFLLIALSLVPLLSMAQDDIYFTPKKKAKEATITPLVRNSRYAKPDTASIVVYSDNKRSDDEYNRRFSYNNGHITGSDDWQDGGSRYDADSLKAESDSVWATYSRDMDDAEDDYYYSRRLLRFHSPRLIAMRNPYYWDLVYGYGCYDYLDYWYSDPFYWNYGWSYGWSWGPWSCWYGPLWGWHSPYAWDYWGWGGCWGYYTYGHGGYWGGSVSRPLSQRIGGQRFRENPFSGRTASGHSIRTQDRSVTPASSFSKHRMSTTSVASTNRVMDRNTSTGTRTSNFPGSKRPGAASYGTVNRGNSTYSDRNSSSRPNSYGSRQTTTTSTPSTSRSTSYSSSSSGGFSSGGYSGGGSSSHSGGGGFGGGHSGGGRR